jgi:Pumilio-family RNA binding repeat
MLGNDVFKQLNSGVATSSTALPGLSIPEDGVAPGGPGAGGGRPTILTAHSASFDQQTPLQQHQQRTSPSSNVTGTTTASTATGSRSNSPYESTGAVGAPSGHTIQAFSNPTVPGSIGTPSGNTGQYSVTGASGVAVQSPAAVSRQTPSATATTTSFVQQGQQFVSQHQHQQQQQQIHQPQIPPHQQQQQILYMMVPTPDGRGQVLQPVQMVQMPNKTFAYVMPGMNPDMAAQMAPPAPQPMMVMMPPPGGGPAPQVGMVPGAAPGVPQMLHQQQATLPHAIPPPQPPIGVGGQTLVGGGGGSGNVGAGGISGRNLSSSESAGNGIGTTYGSAALGGPSTDEYGSATGLGLDGTVGIDLSQYATPATGVADPSMASLYATPQRPPLDTLLGQIRRLSRDQVGCRMVQQALDVEGPMAATLILQEGLPFWGEAMVDPFGNYLFQKILEKITPDERVLLVKSVSTRLVNASLNLHGTRSVQKIVEMCAMDEEAKKAASSSDHIKDTVGGEETGGESSAEVLTKSLAPSAARLCIDSHGNHVIQRILLKLDPKYSQFVFDAVAESVGDVARHRHGCCVIQRCLDSPTGPARSNLVRRIVDKSLELMQDAYGNYVVQYVLDVCCDDDVHAVCESVIGKINLLAIQKFSSNVMEKCLERCTDRTKEHYIQELSDPEHIRELMMDPFGNYVIQRALTVATHAQAIRLVEAMRPHLISQAPGTPNGQRNGGVRNTAGGRRIMAKICRRFPNFNLNAGGTTEELYSQNRTRHHQHNHHGNPMAAGTVYGIATMTPQVATHHLGPQMTQIAPGPIQQPPQQQHQLSQQPIQQQQTLYAANPAPADFSMANTLAMNGLNMGGLQFNQQQNQPFYNVETDANAAYFQHSPQMGHNGAYSNGL